MKIYLYCADSSFDTSRTVRARDLTPRCVIWASRRAQALIIFRRIEEAMEPGGRQFGAAGVRLETARERRKLISPSEGLPDAGTYVADHTGLSEEETEMFLSGEYNFAAVLAR